MRPAGFWRRCAAWSLDACAVALPAFVLGHAALRDAATRLADASDTLARATAQRMAESFDAGYPPFAMALRWMHDPVLLEAAAAVQGAVFALLASALLAFVPLFLVWCVGFERSRWQATPGKRALGLRVVDDGGGRAGTGAVLLRFLAGALSWLTLNLGHLMAALPPRHAALHDRLSGTRVRLADGVAATMPPWAAAWLFVLGAALMAAQAWALAAFQRAMLAALDAALYL